MFRLLLICITFFLLYVGFTYVSFYDTDVKFALGSYQIETTLFVFGVTVLVVLLILLMGLKFIFFLIDLPRIIRNKINNNKLNKLNNKAIKSIAALLVGNKVAALDLASRVIFENKKNNEDILCLIKAEKSKSFDEKIKYLRALINKKSYDLYATKELAKIFFDNSHYAEAEEYAVMAFNKDDTDTETMLLLVRIYAKMGTWSKMIFVVSKIQRADSALLESVSEEIAKYYFVAAKHFLAAEDDSEAVKYLESSLNLKVDYLEALTLYSEIKINMKHTAEVLKILRLAYSYSPTFQIAELFIKCSRSSAEAIYNTLASIVDPADQNALYLAIAAYLDLPEKISELNSRNQVTNDSGH